VRLVACADCHAQFDVTEVTRAEFKCPCGATVENVAHAAVDASIHRCGSCGASIVPDADVCDYCDSSIVRDAEALSLICPECYARNPDDARYCTNCAVAFRPQPVCDGVPELGKLPCPCCEEVMSVRAIGGVHACECLRCNGLWVPNENFNTLVERAADAWRADPEAGLGLLPERDSAPRPDAFKIVYRHCPVCGGIMTRKNFGKTSGVIVDWCGRDGTWLDADELEEIADFISDGGLQKAQSRFGKPDGIAQSMRDGTPEQIERMLEAERLMADARAAQDRRRRTASTVKTITRRRGSWHGQTIADLLEALLGW